MYQSYDLSRYFEGDLPHSTSFTVSDDDAINCAHMLAAGFNTISRNMMGDFVLAVVDTKAGTANYDGKIEKFDRSDKRRDMLESTYAELERVKNVLFDAGVETIPADAGVRDLLAVKRAMSEQIAGLTHEHEKARAAARAELITYVNGAHAKLKRVEASGPRADLEDRFRGMRDVLARFLVAIGETQIDDAHAYVGRLITETGE